MLATRSAPAEGHLTDDFVDLQLANQWFVSSLNLISRVIGSDSEHYRALSKHFNEYPQWSQAQQAFGVLVAAKADVESGALFEMRSLLTAEVFDDFMEQAATLLDTGYFAPAAVVIGAVLEDALRKLSIRNGLSLPPKPKLDSMNSALAKAGVYNLLTQKKLTAIADIRNSAAHGDWTAFTKDDVAEMRRWTSDFIERHLSKGGP